MILKYSSNGTAIWNQEFDGIGNGSDIPTAIISDEFGNVYVTGMSMGEETELDFFTIKLNGTTGAQIWSQRYDQAGLYDIPISIDIDNDGNIVVIGASAKTVVKWKMVALKYAPNGTLIGESVIENETLAFERPSDFTKDDFGNYYITGVTTQDGSNFDMKTVKLDSDLNLLWKKEFNYGKTDNTSAVGVDLEGNVFVTGWVSNEQEGTEFMTLKYSSNGELLWTRRRTSREGNAIAKSNGIAIDEDGNVIIAGEVDFGEKSEAIVCQYDSEGQTKWEKKLPNQGFHKNKPSGVLINDAGDIYITGISKNENEKTYTSAKLKRKKRDLTPVLSGNEEPLYVRDEVIIRVKPEHLNINFVDNLGLTFGKVSEVISNPAAIAEMDSALEAEGDFTNWCVIKVHEKFTSQITTVVSNVGETLAVPDFWGTFLLVIPRRYHGYRETRKIANILDGEELRNFLRYAELNLISTLDDCPPDDEPFYMWQGNLHEITYQGVNYHDGHINIEPAWCIETGSSDIKVGVLDTGIFWAHEDYGDGTFSGSVIDGGTDFSTGAPTAISTTPDNDGTNHGTRVAGLIGAIRNNEKGVGAIAGGNDGTGGVRLWAYKTAEPGGSPLTNGIAAYALATVTDGVNLITNSWGISPANPSVDSDIQSLREQIHLANRAGIIQMASRGNSGTNISRYPCTSEDDWVLCVGGSGLNGEYDGYNFGLGMDVVAPSKWQLNRTTSTNPNNFYEGISATSGATPNVTGLASLLVSHYQNSVSPNGDNLVQEDVEYVIQRTADDITSDDNFSDIVVGYDDRTGHGKINAGNALELVKHPDCQIFHFGRGVNAGESIQFQAEVEEGVSITLTEPYTSSTGVTFDKGDYTADVYKVVATYQHDLPSNFIFDDLWARHTNSTVLPKYGTDGILAPVENVQIVDFDESTVTLEGYIYNLQGEGWMPQFLSSVETNLTYSVLACQITNSKDVDLAKLDFDVFPNPTSNLLGIAYTLKKIEDVSIEIIDVQGKVILYKKYEKQDMNRTVEAIDVSLLSAGIYYCRLTTPTITTTEKFVKI